MLLSALLAPALAVTVDAGVGYRRTLDLIDGAPMGVHLFARAAVDAPVWDHFGVEVRAYGRFPGRTLSPLAEDMVIVAFEANNETKFRQPVDREAASLGAYVAASPWPRRHLRRSTAWIYGLAGAEGRVVIKDWAVLNPDYAGGVEGAPYTQLRDDPAVRVVVGPAFGLGFDAWFLDRFGVRATAVERAAVVTEPDYNTLLADGSHAPLDQVLTLSPAVSVDVMVRF